MGFPIVTLSFLFTLVSVLSIVNCQSRVKVIRPQSLEVETRFNWSSIAENLTLPSEAVRFFEYAQLPAVYQNERQPICDERCGLPYDPSGASGTRIMGGASTKPNQFPWMVELLVVTADFFKQSKVTCGATLIKKQYLLTAAHCIYHRKVVSITAFVGYHYLDVNKFNPTGYEQVIPVSQAFIHDDFDITTMQHDLAILELAKPVRFTDQVHTVCLAQKDSELTDAVVAGWGTTEVYGTKFYPQLLLSTKVALVKLNQCRRALKEIGRFITDQSICAGGSTSDACAGDSGGPLMASVNSTGSRVRFDQIGIVSWGIGCGQDGIPGIYASVKYHLPWIQQVTRKDTCRPVSPNSPN
ncbi:trypsin-1-like [Daphnia pulex]|uniref:trypsin-1-like n=1 Tax=Daphnia pulex TaxID=6669 RepID=UPI001EDE735A|nr:trypsin-1-like [Daphnia pulex]